MRKAWRRIFLLCAACMICMCGLCLAKDGGNLVELFHVGFSFYYVDTSSVKTHQWGGRKYLELVFVDDKLDKWSVNNLTAIDIEKRKGVILECGAQAVNDISDIENGVMDPTTAIVIKKLISWTEQNRPDIINEILTFNRSGQSAGKTDVTDTMQRGGKVDAAGDLTPSGFIITDDGWVQYTCRSENFNGNDIWTDDTPHFIFARSASLSKILGGFHAEYIVAAIIPEHWFGGHFTGMWRPLMAFDYDAQSNVFTFYGVGTHYPDFDNNNSLLFRYTHRIRVIDRNHVYYENLGGSFLEDGKPFAQIRGTLS